MPVDFVLTGLNQDFTLGVSGELAGAAPPALDVSSTAIYNIKLSDMLNVFKFQSDSFDVNNTDASDIQYYVYMNAWPADLSLNPANAHTLTNPMKRAASRKQFPISAEMDGRAPNLVFHDGKLYGAVSRDKRRGVAAIDPATGKVLTWGPTSGGHDTTLAFGKDVAVWPTGYTGDRTEGKSNPATTPGHGMTTYTVVSLPDLKVLGAGHLYPEAPAGEIAARHIARIGTARVVWGNAGITAWGSRIFVRNNDYLWCIGDPGKPLADPGATRSAGEP